MLLLEKHKAPPCPPQDSNWRDATSIPSFPTYSKIRQAFVKVFDDMIIYIGASLSPPRPTMPSTAIYNHEKSGQRAPIPLNPIESLLTYLSLPA